MHKVMAKPGPEFIMNRDEAKVLLKLCNDIEEMASGVTFSESVWTPQRTVHITFMNGVALRDGEVYLPSMALETCATATLEAVRAYRDSIAEDVGLVWRREPELRRDDGGYSIYTRLCFEPVSWAQIVDLEDTVRTLREQLAEAQRTIDALRPKSSDPRSLEGISGKADGSVLPS